MQRSERKKAKGEYKSRAKGQKNKGADRKRGYLGAERLHKLSVVKEVTAPSENSQLVL